jgi:hypothetical protein
MTQVVILVGIIIDNYLQMSYLMGNGNSYMCHDCMCWCDTIVTM